MNTEFLNDFLELQKLVGPCKSNIELILKVNKFLRVQTTEKLEEIVYIIYGKWPHCQYREILIRAVARAIQNKFYTNIYNKSPADPVLTRNNSIITSLDLRDTRCEKRVVEVVKLQKKPKAEKVYENKPLSELKTHDDLKKCSARHLFNIIRELKIEDEKVKKIEELSNKSAALAKMQLINIIEKKLSIKHGAE